MRLTRLKLERFKIIEQAELRLAPVTLLIGGNNAGKSTVLQALTLLAQSVGERQLQMTGPYVDLGRTPAALLNRSSRVGDGWSVEMVWEDSGPQTPMEVVFVCRAETPDTSVATEGIVRFETPHRRSVTVRAWDSAVGPRLEVDAASPDLSTAVGPSGLQGALTIGRLPTSPNWRAIVPPSAADDLSDAPALAAYAQTVSGPYLDASIADALRSYRYVGPDRHFTRSAYNLSDQRPQVLWQQDDLANALAYDREVRRAVDQRCRDMFGFGISADFAQGRNVDLVAVSANGEPYSLNHMGSGFGQVVWIAVFLELQLQAARADRMVPVVGIEEAELHLHPAAQPSVARMLAAYARYGVQQILTTQSEHLLIALLQQVAAGELRADDLVVYHLDGGRAERLEVDERGRLSGGLKGFFEANEAELLSHLDALIHADDQS